MRFTSSISSAISVQAADIGALHRDRAHRERRQRHRDVAAVEPDDDELAALDQAVDAEPRRRRRADQIDHRPGAAVGRRDDLLRRIGARRRRSPPCAPAFLRGLALDRIDVDDDARCARPSPCASARHIRPRPPAPMITIGSVLQRRADLLQRAVGGDARAGERRGALRRQIADVEQIARMRHHQMIAVAAVARTRRGSSRLAAEIAPRRAGRPRIRRSRSRDATSRRSPTLTPLRLRARPPPPRRRSRGPA